MHSALFRFSTAQMHLFTPLFCPQNVWLLFSILGTSAHQITQSVLPHPPSLPLPLGVQYTSLLDSILGVRFSFARRAYQTARKKNVAGSPKFKIENPIEELKCLPWRLSPTPVAFINTKLGFEQSRRN